MLQLNKLIIFFSFWIIFATPAHCAHSKLFSVFHKDSLTITKKIKQQQSDSLEKKVTVVWDSLYTDKPLKSPVKVMLKSMIVPGWGQLDNGKKLKAITFLAVESALFYKIFTYNKNYQSKHFAIDLAKRKDYTWYLAMVHLYCVLDAVTDAYLYKFDDIMGENKKVTLWKEDQLYWASFLYSF